MVWEWDARKEGIDVVVLIRLEGVGIRTKRGVTSAIMRGYSKQTLNSFSLSQSHHWNSELGCFHSLSLSVPKIIIPYSRFALDGERRRLRSQQEEAPAGRRRCSRSHRCRRSPHPAADLASRQRPRARTRRASAWGSVVVVVSPGRREIEGLHRVLFDVRTRGGAGEEVEELTMLLSDLLWDDMVAGPDTQRIPVPYAEWTYKVIKLQAGNNFLIFMCHVPRSSLCICFMYFKCEHWTSPKVKQQVFPATQNLRSR